MTDTPDMGTSRSVHEGGMPRRVALPFRRSPPAPQGNDARTETWADADARPGTDVRARVVARDPAALGTATAAGLLAIFVVSLLIPLHFQVGGLRLTPMRVFLLVACLPLLLRLVMGRAGRMRLIDLFMGLHFVWIFVALVIAHGAERIPYAGATVLEMMGGYLIGRVLVLNATDYRLLIRYLLTGLVVLLPFALLETVTGEQPLRDLAAMVAETFEKPTSSMHLRMGLSRAMVVFEHPILLGLFATMALGPMLYLYRRPLGRLLALTATLLVVAFSSLSSAPMLGILLQGGLTLWDRLSQERWKLFVLLSTALYFAVDLASNRTPLTVMIHYLTFDSHTGWTRIHIWDAGVAAVRQQPVFGYGLASIPRPDWLTASIDNYWLVLAVRYGLPGLGFLVFGIAAGLLAVLRARNLSDEARAIRTGHLIMLVGVFMVLGTVHVWGATMILMMAMIGATLWLAGPAAQADPAKAVRTPPDGPGAGRAAPVRHPETSRPGTLRPETPHPGTSRSDGLPLRRPTPDAGEGQSPRRQTVLRTGAGPRPGHGPGRRNA